MKKIGLGFVLVLLFVFMGATGAVWAEEGAVSPAGTLTRGEFAAMLAEAGNLESGTVSAAEMLVQRGFMQGYPGGELFLDQPITWAEGITLAAKVLGLKEDFSLPPSTGPVLEKEGYPVWCYNYAAWLHRFGLPAGKPADGIGKAEGKAFLEKLFSTDPAAADILEKNAAVFAEVKTLRTTTNGQMKIIPRPGVEGAEEITEISMSMDVCQEMVLPDKLCQKSTVTVNMPGEAPEEMEIASEMYVIGGKYYMQMPDPETGAVKWFVFPEGLLPDPAQMFNVEKQMQAVPPELEDLLFYRLLGSREVNGEEVYAVAFYGCIDDLGRFMEAAFRMLGDAQQFQQLIAESANLIDTMSIWGIQYYDSESYATKGAELDFVLTFAEEMFGQPNPIKAMQLFLKIDECEVNIPLSIELPEEAAGAALLELPAALEFPAA